MPCVAGSSRIAFVVVDPASTPKTSGPFGWRLPMRSRNDLHLVLVTIKRREPLKTSTDAKSWGICAAACRA